MLRMIKRTPLLAVVFLSLLNCACESFFEEELFIQKNNDRILARHILITSNELVNCEVSASAIIFDGYYLQHVEIQLKVTNKADRPLIIDCNNIGILSTNYNIAEFSCKGPRIIEPGKQMELSISFREEIIYCADRKRNEKAYKENVLSIQLDGVIGSKDKITVADLKLFSQKD